MERNEFLLGWSFLIAQPWGKAYRDDNPTAKIQIELYYLAVLHASASLWQETCAQLAQGEHWPSIGQLKQTMHLLGERTEPRPLIDRNATIQWEDAPWPLQIVFNHQAQHHTTLKESAEAVLPQWLTENPHHEDYADAAAFLDKAKLNFGVRPTKRGNIRCVP